MKKEALDRIRRRMDAEIAKLGTLPSAETIDEIEDLAMRLRERAGQIAAEELARKAGDSEEASPQKLECSCGRWACFKGERPREVVMMASTAKFTRRYYYCRRCDAGFCPAAARVGCEGSSFSMRVRQETAQLACLASSYRLGVGLLYDPGGRERLGERGAADIGGSGRGCGYSVRRAAGVRAFRRDAERPRTGRAVP